MIRREFLKAIPKLGAAAGLAIAAPQVVQADSKGEPNPRPTASLPDEIMAAIMNGGLYGLFKAGILPLNPHFFQAMGDGETRDKILSDWAEDASDQYADLEPLATTSTYLRATPVSKMKRLPYERSPVIPRPLEKHARFISVSSGVIHNDDLDAFVNVAARLASSPLKNETARMASMVVSGGRLNDDLFTTHNKNVLGGNPSIEPGPVDKAKRQLRHNTGNDELQLKDCTLVYDKLYVPRITMALGVGLGMLPTLPHCVHHPGLGDAWFLTTQHQSGHVMGEYQYLQSGATPYFEIDVNPDAQRLREPGERFDPYIEATVHHVFGIKILNPHFIVGSDGTQS